MGFYTVVKVKRANSQNMVRINSIPQQSFRLQQNFANTNKDQKRNDCIANVSFMSNQLDAKVSRPTIFSFLNPQKKSLPWIKEENLLEAVNNLNYLEFDKNDVKHVQSLGVVLPFLSGTEAVKFIKNSHTEIKFAPMSSENTHAQYDYEDNCIKINEIYKDTKNPAEILAISESILHEAGHAKDQDDVSTVQEEFDCLAMNALSHRAICKSSPNIFEQADSKIVKDGVCLYADLFFDSDPKKLALLERVKMKYGNLPVGDLKHSPSGLALDVKNT